MYYLFSSLVGNIPYEATEEQLKDIFSEVGPVVSFRWDSLSLPGGSFLKITTNLTLSNNGKAFTDDFLHAFFFSLFVYNSFVLM